MAERTVLVTGCSSGFGLGLARRFAERGWNVLAGLRNPQQCPPELAALRNPQQCPPELARLRSPQQCPSQRAASPHAAGTTSFRIVPLDLEDDAQIAATAVLAERLDCLVNNAAYGLTGPFATYTAEQMRRQMDVNALAPALLTQTLLPALGRARGRVINISSLVGETGLPMNALYSASKHALEGWSEALYYELAAHGIQVALVEPGGHRTRFAENAVWGERPTPAGSIEERQLAGYRAMRARRLAGPGNDATRVVDVVVRLAEMKRMPLRTRVGGDARALHALERCLPERVANALIAAIFRRRLGEQRK